MTKPTTAWTGTDEELDRARAEEAHRLFNVEFPGATMEQRKTRTIWSREAHYAARLAREGWLPPDPLADEVTKLYEGGVEGWWRYPAQTEERLRAALQRGIELGRHPA